MEKDLKKEAIHQYFCYFRKWFIVTGILVALLLCFFVRKVTRVNPERGNLRAEAERVYDFADVLTAEEESMLREYIAQKEADYQMDFVLVTISTDVEAQGDWYDTMQSIADDFYDQNNFGYNKIHGDGILLLDNWYENQEGSHLSTCGKVEKRFGTDDVDSVLDAVYVRVDKSPFNAYMAYVDQTCRVMSFAGGLKDSVGLMLLFIMIIPLALGGSFMFTKLRQSKTPDTTNAATFVRSHQPTLTGKKDDFIRKNVTFVKIDTHSSGGSSRGGGGHHVSSGGVSHGGGGRRR